jgi:polar amino acid transport system substrate-binding protein
VVRDVSDLAQLRIGVVRDDIGDQLVRQLALSDGVVTRKNSLKQLLYLLEAGRVDVVAYAVDVFYHSVRKAKLGTEKFAEALVLKKGQLGYAFHKSTPSEVLAPLQDAIDALRAEGVIDRIIAKYRD